jgi:hypothetical protein
MPIKPCSAWLAKDLAAASVYQGKPKRLIELIAVQTKPIPSP